MKKTGEAALLLFFCSINMALRAKRRKGFGLACGLGLLAALTAI